MAEAQSSILIVDDDAEDLSAVEQALDSLNASIVTLQDPHEVLPTVRALAPDVVVLDALLPGLSGFDLCKEIKTDPELKTTQVLIITAVYLRQQYRHEALQQFKADAFLTKPFRAPELQRLVGGLLARRARMPQGSLLSRLGLPGGTKPATRSLFGRLFGRAEEGSGADTRLTPPRRRREEPGRSSSRLGERESPIASSPSPSEPASEEEPAGPGGPIALPDAFPEVETNGDSNPTEPAAEAEAKEEVTGMEDDAEAKDEGPGIVQRELFADPSSEPRSPASEAVAAEDTEPAATVEPVAETDAVDSIDPAAEADEKPLAESSTDLAATKPEPPKASESEGATVVLEETSDADGATEARVFAEAAIEPGEAEAAAASAVEDAVASVEQATSSDDVKVAHDEPSAAETLEAAPSDSAANVSWEPAAEAPAPELSFEPSKTLPGVELPESLKSPVLSPAEPVSRELLAEAVEATVPEEPAREEAASEPNSVPEPDPEPPVTLAKRHRPRRRVGEAPVFDEDEFDAELSRELSKCRRVDRPLTLILIQVDDLDQIIELFGKEFREEVLWHVANQAMGSLREVDIVGIISSKDRIAMTAFASDRYGGSRIVTRMRRKVGNHPIRVGEELPPIIPALTFGMASYPEDADDVELLISRAEEDLRGAKTHGRD